MYLWWNILNKKLMQYWEQERDNTRETIMTKQFAHKFSLTLWAKHTSNVDVEGKIERAEKKRKVEHPCRMTTLLRNFWSWCTREWSRRIVGWLLDRKRNAVNSGRRLRTDRKSVHTNVTCYISLKTRQSLGVLILCLLSRFLINDKRSNPDFLSFFFQSMKCSVINLSLSVIKISSCY